MKLIMKGRLTEGPIIADPESARLGVDLIALIAKTGAWRGDVFLVYEVGDLHTSQMVKAVQRAREGVPQQVIAMLTWDGGVCPVELADRYRDEIAFPALAGVKEKS